MKETFLEELRSHDLHALAAYSKNCPYETAKAVIDKGRAETLEDLAALISPAGVQRQQWSLPTPTEGIVNSFRIPDPRFSVSIAGPS